MKQICEIINNYLIQRSFTYRSFAKSISYDGCAPVTHVTIGNWISGKTEPSTDFLIQLLIKFKDWRFDMALECLAARKPEIWGTEGAIWRIKEP